jgi:hypothetical protein
MWRTAPNIHCHVENLTDSDAHKFPLSNLKLKVQAEFKDVSDEPRFIDGRKKACRSWPG